MAASHDSWASIFTNMQTRLYIPRLARNRLLEQSLALTSSIVRFYVKRVFKATGSTKMYYSDAAQDPQNQRNLINFRHYFIAMPKKEDAMAVLISDKAAA